MAKTPEETQTDMSDRCELINKITLTRHFSNSLLSNARGGQSTQLYYLSKSTDTR